MNLVMNLIFGILFEMAFITLMIIRIKDIKEKKIRLFLSVFFSYIFSGLLVNFDTSYINQYLVYIALTILIYLFCKFLYKRKTNIIDLFIIFYIIMTINYVSLLSIKLISYNYFSMTLSRLILLLVFIKSNKINRLYKKITKNWNRNKGNKIKSITLRNYFIIIANFSLFIINYYLINYLSIILS